MQTEEKIKAGWNFDNSYTRLPKIFYTRLEPTPVRSPQLVILNESLAESLGLNGAALQTEEGIAGFAGNRIPKGAAPLAQAYAGHQFGHFTMLGDGRTLLIGEHIAPTGKRVDIQLKGSGRTPYSRRGDGRAVLGPMLREYIISEAMYGMGIPTTRSLAVVTTGETVLRQDEQPGAILTRVAASHLRVGTFEYVSQWGTVDDLRALADYTIERHFPDVNGENRYLSMLREVVKRQASLIAKWQLVGFIHGVMNTDNMAISGETIDYGPCAFMDAYDPKTVFSSIDTYGRYAYGNQPHIAGWNLARFAETLLPLLHENQEQSVELAQEAISDFSGIYSRYWLEGMRKKLGLFNQEPADASLVEDLLAIMHKYMADFTNTFRDLAYGLADDTDFYRSLEFSEWQKQWLARISRQQEEESTSRQLMQENNPALIPRNYRVEEALAAADKGDYNVLKRLLNVLASPYAYQKEQEAYSSPPQPSDCPYQTFCGT